MGSKYFEKAYGIAGRFSWQNKAMWGTCSISSALTVGSAGTTGRLSGCVLPAQGSRQAGLWALRERAPLCDALHRHGKVTPSQILSSEPAWSLRSLPVRTSTWVQVNCIRHHPQTLLSQSPQTGYKDWLLTWMQPVSAEFVVRLNYDDRGSANAKGLTD